MYFRINSKNQLDCIFKYSDLGIFFEVYVIYI